MINDNVSQCFNAVIFLSYLLRTTEQQPHFPTFHSVHFEKRSLQCNIEIGFLLI